MRRFALPAAWIALTTATLFAPLPASRATAQAPAPEPDASEPAPTEAMPAPAWSKSAEAGAAGVASAKQPEQAQEEQDRHWDLRAGSTYYGPAGGLYVVDAASGAERSFRLQAITDFFVIKDYLYNDDKNRYVGSSFALSVTPIKYLELSAAVATRSNRNSRTSPEVLQSLGNLYFDIKSWGEPTRGLALGGDVLINFKNAPSGGIDGAGTSVGLRANVSLDLRKMTQRQVPLQLRMNVGYLFDNSAKIVERTEDRRLRNLQDQGISNAAGASDEYRHLARRDERLAFGVNRLDELRLGLGLEVPLAPHERFAIHPLAEWQLGIPVNRQGFDCPYVTGPSGGKLGGTDSCLDREGADTFHQRVVAGVRMYPGSMGLSFLLAAELGVGGTTNFVQELSPAAPYRVLLAASYTADVKPKPPAVVIQKVETRVEVPTAAKLGRIHGSVMESGEDVVVADARITFPGRDVSRIVSGADGTFTSYAFPPGPVQLEVEAEGYEPGNCSTTIPPQGGDVSLACMLIALPRVGTLALSVLDENGAPRPGVGVTLSGPEPRTVVTDAEGQLRLSDLAPGDYRARIEQPGYLLSISTVSVRLRQESSHTVQLVPVPSNPAVKVRADRLQVRGTIFFAPNTATIEPRSTPLLAELANTLIQHSELVEVEVQGHTDDTGSAARNTQLSEQRALAVKDWLVNAGVERERLLAKGYGADKPVAPNLTEQNRARNRRVEFVILRRAEGQ